MGFVEKWCRKVLFFRLLFVKWGEMRNFATANKINATKCLFVWYIGTHSTS